MRLGQVGDSPRSKLDLTRTAMAMAPHGTFTVHGRKNKGGEKIALTREQRVAVDHALETVLADAEREYEAGNKPTTTCIRVGSSFRAPRAWIARGRRPRRVTLCARQSTRSRWSPASHPSRVAAGTACVAWRRTPHPPTPRQ
jgi:hypothetical protein